jgi:vacuolar protein sorting-associated protein 13A/C
MKDLNEGAYRREHYVAHIRELCLLKLSLHSISDQLSVLSNHIVLLTTMRVLSFRPKRLQLIWELPFTEVQNVTVENAGIRFTHKSGKERDKYIHVPDKESQSWLFGEVASVVKSFNAKLRMES